MTTTLSAADRNVVVVGAGHAAASLVGLLRQEGHTGRITMLGEELDYPYHRPPLSKKFAEGELEQWLRPPEFYREQDVEVRLGEQVTEIDRKAGRIVTASGERIGYDVLVLATGSRPRPLPVAGAGLAGVGALRNLGDARALRKWVGEGRKLAIIGGGYIGLEVAAVARAAGAEAVVLEREDRVLARVASPQLSAILTARHTEQGTVVRTRVGVTGLEGAAGQVQSVVLEGGETIDCTAALVGIGALPCDELAAACDLERGPAGGIVVDEFARTSDPAILAIGDVTCRRVPGLDGIGRLESIPSATEQARQAVAAILGTPSPQPETPWFWSDQFDLKLKIAGVVRPGADVVRRGDPETGRFALFHLRDGVPVAVESANASPDFMAGKKWIGAGTSVDPVRLADPGIALRDAVR
ncbi:NAD(P)/FAD-dependent oxidoreductase [Rhodococcus ruber]|uniref:NAD(P)/FAD-dependent oxidoreductase n=1 Tax=Rhodococcus TaxID=1827 RepID=UPI00029A4EE0|nr:MULTISPECIES: FAD-dependent oxidoreductase [Rhodococcus]ATQ29194.1 ferredoxin reductase [Rhodococcus ruber]AWH00632.1 ferredoxin reductase [Rhodococcus ruber]QDC16033.1 ferredoxin reductase [Rhodococcus ruber]UIR35073.1 FAD-dependent oxidoreductase [Rhodococcus sp. DMF-1]